MIMKAIFAYLIVKFESLGIITSCLSLHSFSCNVLGANVSSKNTSQYVIVAYRPVQPTSIYYSQLKYI